MKWAYTIVEMASNNEVVEHSGTIEAISPEEATFKLLQKGYYVKELRRATGADDKLDHLKSVRNKIINRLAKKLKPKEPKTIIKIDFGFLKDLIPVLFIIVLFIVYYLYK